MSLEVEMCSASTSESRANPFWAPRKTIEFEEGKYHPHARHAHGTNTVSGDALSGALTRGRESNLTYLYERTIGEADPQPPDQTDADGVHLVHRRSPTAAAGALRQVIGRDEPACTANQTRAALQPNNCPRWRLTWSPSTTTRSPSAAASTRKPNARNVIGPWIVTSG